MTVPLLSKLFFGGGKDDWGLATAPILSISVFGIDESSARPRSMFEA